jgi:hypothetical protein
MSKTPTLRSRVLNLLQTARMVGLSGVTLAALTATLSGPTVPLQPETVLASVLSDMTETPEGADAPPVHCAPGPTLVLR